MKTVSLTFAFILLAFTSRTAFAQQTASVDQLKFLDFLIGEWHTPEGTATWEWTLNGRVLSFESFDEAGNHKMSGKAIWDPSQKVIVNRFYTSSGNFYTQTWTQRKKLEEAVVVCFPNGKYYFTMRDDGEGGVVVEHANGKTDKWTKKRNAGDGANEEASVE